MCAHLCRVLTMLVREAMMGPRILTPSRIHYNKWVLTSAGCWLCWWERQWWAPEYWHYQEYITINECSPLQGADYVGEGGNDGPQNTDTIKNTLWEMSAHLCRVLTMLVREATMGPRILTPSRMHYDKWALTSAGCWLCWWGRQRWAPEYWHH
jgi:hypothetical protein